MKHLRKNYETRIECANRLSQNEDKPEFIIFKPNTIQSERVLLKKNGHIIYESITIKYLGI